jgi:MarR family transcriptional regulator for hemolysin
MEQALIPFRRKLFGEFDLADIETTLRVVNGLNTLLAKPADLAAGRKAA